MYSTSEYFLTYNIHCKLKKIFSMIQKLSAQISLSAYTV